MNTIRMIDRPRVNGVVIPDITSDTVYVQGVRDQTGVMSGIIFNETAAGLPDYTLEIQGAAEDEGAGTVWHALQGTSIGGEWIDQRVGSISFTIEFPLMPMLRMVFTQTDTVNGYERVEAWITE